MRCSTTSRSGRTACTPISCTPIELKPAQRADLVAQADYGGPLTAIVGRDNMVGTQFHPEKSQRLGLEADREFFEVGAVILFPAIDLKEGLAVRLEQGDMARATVFNRDPAAQARAFEQAGLRISAHRRSRRRLCRQAGERRRGRAHPGGVSIPVQLGGGIRNTATVEGWLEKGVARVIIGTAAVRDPPFVKQAARDYPGRIAVGLDARDGKVAVEGWAETSELSALDIARRFEDAGVAAIIFTDIARDGLLKGLNLDATLALAEAISIPVIASGGLASSTTSRRCWRRARKSSPAPSPAARSMTGGSMLREALKLHP